jgi:hypothetical protein
MKPMRRERKVASSASESVQTSVPSSRSVPSVGLVKAPSMAIRVDFPEPDRPTIDTNSPTSSSRVTSRTAS